MRVVGGSAKGRALSPVPGDTTRPILDRVKTALFDILRPRLADMRVLDLFAGSGGVGIEALSQGAAHCTFLDIEKKAIETIQKNISTCRLEERADVRLADAFAFIRKSRAQFDLIYIAPPQYKSLWVEALHAIAERPDLLAPEGVIIAQIDPKEYQQTHVQAFCESNQRKYGNTLLVFLERTAASSTL